MSASSVCSFECISTSSNSGESCSSEIVTRNESDVTLLYFKNELHNWLLKLEKDFTLSEEGNITAKGETIRQELDPDGFMEVNEKFIECLGNVFETLDLVTDLLVNSIKEEENGTICFLGKTGSGKSTVVEILGSDNTKIYSEEVSANLFIIKDDLYIGTNTVVSKTLYPRFAIDEESSYILCDFPGFADSRSPIHEIITMVSLRKFLQHIKKIKIVIVCPQASLSNGGDRGDFVSVLKNLSQLINDTEKFKNCIYLIGNKIENTFVKKNGEWEITSNASVIDNITSFLLEVKLNLNNENNMNILEGELYKSAAVQIIDCLLQKTDGAYDHINILRKPAEQGCVSDISELQSQRDTIREMLLTNKDFVEIDKEDFQIVLTDSVVRFLNNTFKILDSYIRHLTSLVSANIKNHYETVIKNVICIDEVREKNRKLINYVTILCDGIEKCRNPKEYFVLIQNFSAENNFSIDFLPNFNKLCLLYELLSDLQNQSNGHEFSPLDLSALMRPVSKFLEMELEQYNFLKEIYEMLYSYKIQKTRRSALSYFSEISPFRSESSDYNFAKFLEVVGLNNKNDQVQINGSFMNRLNRIIDQTFKHTLKFDCPQNEKLVIFDYIVLLSEVKDILRKYRGVNEVIIFAMHTIFIDVDFNDNQFKYKQLIIIAPVWKVDGTRIINLDGTHYTPYQQKAMAGHIGKDGKRGNPGGKFLGFGMEFNDCKNLTITASGGNGQDGQDGGDGENGRDGNNATLDEKKGIVKQGRRIITVIFNHGEEVKDYDGELGTPGTNSGEGGVGGLGGKKGIVTVYDIREKGHGISVVTNDGKPGKKGADGKPGIGGKNGNKITVKSSGQYIIIIPVHTSTESDVVPNDTRAADGEVLRKSALEIDDQSTGFDCQFEDDMDLENIDVNQNLDEFKKYFVDKFSTTSTDCTTVKFIDDALKYVCRLNKLF